MTKTEVEALLEEFDEALVQAFPGPKPMSVLLVGGACLLLQGITAQPTDSVEVIIFEMLGSPERTLIFHSPIADKIRRIIREIGKRRGLKGERQQFINDDSAPFLLELSEHELPPMLLLKAYRKLYLYAPRNLGYLLACKLMIGRPEKDGADLAVLCQVLAIQNRAQAQQIVDRYFPSPVHQANLEHSSMHFLGKLLSIWLLPSISCKLEGRKSKNRVSSKARRCLIRGTHFLL